jgi:hypothetical protein
MFFGSQNHGTSKKHNCTSKFCKPMASDNRQFSDKKWPCAFPIACPMYLFKDDLNTYLLNFKCCLSVHVDDYTIIPTKCTSFYKKHKILQSVLSVFVFLAPTCFNTRGPS